MRARSILLAALLSIPCAGCYSTWDIPLKEVNRLDGYRAPKERRITDKDGEEVPVDADTELRFRADGGRELRGHFVTLAVHERPEAWLLQGIFHGDDQAVRVDMRKVVAVQARRYSPGKTAVLAVVPTVAVGVAVGVTLGLVVAAFSHGAW